MIVKQKSERLEMGIGRKKITTDMIGQMQKDRDAGMDTTSITKKYGVSAAAVCNYTQNHKKLKRLEEVRKTTKGFILSNGRVMIPITPEEIAAKQASLRIGARMEIPVMQYDETGIQLGRKKELCQVEHVSRHVVVFRRPNGRPEHRTVVELCRMGRKENDR